MLSDARKWIGRAGLIAWPALLAAQTATQVLTPAVKRVGDKLACLCGACKNTVANCPMLECHYALPARQKIMKLLDAGFTDQQIIDNFVQEHGLKALAVPPAEGFNVLAWLMPWVALALGLVTIWFWLKRFRKPAPVAMIDDAALDRYHDQIEKDLSKLD